MSDALTPLEKTIGNALSGKGSHVATGDIFSGLDWKLAGQYPPNAPHTIFQILNHMSYWQTWGVEWLGGANPPVPAHAAAGWPGAAGPTSPEEWDLAVRNFTGGLAALGRASRKPDLLTRRGRHTPLGILQAIAAHNSYHAGQVVVLRQILGAWPPPSGGLTW